MLNVDFLFAVTHELPQAIMHAPAVTSCEPISVSSGSGKAETVSRGDVTCDLSKPCYNSTKSSCIPVGIDDWNGMPTILDRADIVQRRQ